MKALLPALLVLTLIACERETRRFREIAPASAPSTTNRMTPLHPGPPSSPTSEYRHVPLERTVNAYESNAFAIAEGKRLYIAFNCNGCHALGGGGMGPALMDAKWIYGGQPEDIYSTISEGRRNGMPSFGGRIPEYQIWQLAAYVRSLSGHVRKDAAPGRSDHMHARQRELAIETQPIVDDPEKAP